jgi:hypothetical protein
LFSERLIAQRFKIKSQRIGTNSGEPAHAHMNAMYNGSERRFFNHLPQQTFDYGRFVHGNILPFIQAAP